MNTDLSLPNLEEALAEMTQLIDKMEQGELSLEQSLQNFERGISLVKHCQKILEQAEQKVSLLTQDPASELITYQKEDKNEHEHGK